jgi:tRNA-specific 2-thiouridylase
MKEFLGHYIESERGDVINEQGHSIGNHQGVLLYTLGERHGFIITEKNNNDLPYYVIAKDISRNQIIVSQYPHKESGADKVALIDCVWRSVPLSNKNYMAQIRYHGEYKSIIINSSDGTNATLLFESKDFSLSPGQSVVVYDNDICIGGGIVR